MLLDCCNYINILVTYITMSCYKEQSDQSGARFRFHSEYIENIISRYGCVS